MHCRSHQIYWTEQYLLYAYLLDNPKTRLLWSSMLGIRRYPELPARMIAGKTTLAGASLWFSLGASATSPAP